MRLRPSGGDLEEPDAPAPAATTNPSESTIAARLPARRVPRRRRRGGPSGRARGTSWSAPGAGAKARTRSASSDAGRPHSQHPIVGHRASAPASPRLVLGAAARAPRPRAVHVCDEQVCPDRRRAAVPSEPASSSGRIALDAAPAHGPVSSPSSSSIAVTPVSRAPASSACCTGLAPRHRGQQREVQVHRAVGDERPGPLGMSSSP